MNTMAEPEADPLAERAAKRRRLPARPLAHLSPCTDPSKRIPVTAISIGRGEHCALQLEQNDPRTHITRDLNTGDGSFRPVHQRHFRWWQPPRPYVAGIVGWRRVALGDLDEASVRLTFFLRLPAPEVQEEEEEEMLEEVETVGHEHGHQADRKDLNEPRERRRAAGSWAGTCSSGERGALTAAAGRHSLALAQPEPLAQPSPWHGICPRHSWPCRSRWLRRVHRCQSSPSPRCEGRSACCRGPVHDAGALPRGGAPRTTAKLRRRWKEDAEDEGAGARRRGGQRGR